MESTWRLGALGVRFHSPAAPYQDRVFRWLLYSARATINGPEFLVASGRSNPGFLLNLIMVMMGGVFCCMFRAGIPFEAVGDRFEEFGARFGVEFGHGGWVDE